MTSYLVMTTHHRSHPGFRSWMLGRQPAEAKVEFLHTPKEDSPVKTFYAPNAIMATRGILKRAPLEKRTKRERMTELRPALSGAAARSISRAPSVQLAAAPAFGQRGPLRPELWRAFKQNENECEVEKRRMRAPRQIQADEVRKGAGIAGGPAAPSSNRLAPISRASARPAGGRLAPISRASVVSPACRRRVDGLSPASQLPAKLGKRRAEREPETVAAPSNTKGASRTRYVPMCLCCGGLLEAAEEQDNKPRKDSRLLKCNKCGLVSRVAA